VTVSLRDLRGLVVGLKRVALSSAKRIAVVVLMLGATGAVILIVFVEVFRWSCSKTTVNNAEQALAVSKGFILSSKSTMETLHKYQVDTSIFEDSVAVKETMARCDRLPRYHFVRPAENGAFRVYWQTSVKGDCEDCWEIVGVMTSVSRGVDYVEYARPEGEFKVCPPRYWPPRPDQQSTE